MFSYLTDFDLQFPNQSTTPTDFAHIMGMLNLTQFTICFSMKARSNTSGTPFSYAVPESKNELLIFDYRRFRLFVGGQVR